MVFGPPAAEYSRSRSICRAHARVWTVKKASSFIRFPKPVFLVQKLHLIPLLLRYKRQGSRVSQKFLKHFPVSRVFGVLDHDLSQVANSFRYPIPLKTMFLLGTTLSHQARRIHWVTNVLFEYMLRDS